MRFGFFDQLPCPSGFSERQRYRDFIAQIELGDALGFDTASLGEIHFSRTFSISGGSAYGAGRSGPTHDSHSPRDGRDLVTLAQPDKDGRRSGDRRHPKRRALGIRSGPGRRVPVSGLRRSPGREPRAVRGPIDSIIQAWTNEPFSFEGKYFRTRDLSVVPKPLQSPHPPVRVAANSPDTFPFSGRRKLPIFASPLINPPDKLKAGLAIYRDTLAGTSGDTALAFPVHVTTSRAQARQDREAGLLRFLRVTVELVRPKDQSDFKLRGFSPSPGPLRTGQIRGL